MLLLECHVFLCDFIHGDLLFLGIALIDPLMELYLHFKTVKLVVNTGVDYRGHMQKIGVN